MSAISKGTRSKSLVVLGVVTGALVLGCSSASPSRRPASEAALGAQSFTDADKPVVAGSRYSVDSGR